MERKKDVRWVGRWIEPAHCPCTHPDSLSVVVELLVFVEKLAQPLHRPPLSLSVRPNQVQTSRDLNFSVTIVFAFRKSCDRTCVSQIIVHIALVYGWVVSK